jgi:hypothetical protein
MAYCLTSLSLRLWAGSRSHSSLPRPANREQPSSTKTPCIGRSRSLESRLGFRETLSSMWCIGRLARRKVLQRPLVRILRRRRAQPASPTAPPAPGAPLLRRQAACLPNDVAIANVLSVPRPTAGHQVFGIVTDCDPNPAAPPAARCWARRMLYKDVVVTGFGLDLATGRSYPNNYTLRVM